MHEISWKGSKARSIGAEFKLYYHGMNRKKNGVSMILKKKYAKMLWR